MLRFTLRIFLSVRVGLLVSGVRCLCILMMLISWLCGFMGWLVCWILLVLMLADDRAIVGGLMLCIVGCVGLVRCASRLRLRAGLLMGMRRFLSST